MEATMILLLTHRTDLAEQITQSLTTKGYRVCVPQRRADLRQHLASTTPELVILDMCELDHYAGDVALQDLRRRGFTGPVITISGHPEASSRDDSYGPLLHSVLIVPSAVGAAYDLGELELAVETSFE
jgi:DNA-binding response OmpR family regulator